MAELGVALITSQVVFMLSIPVPLYPPNKSEQVPELPMQCHLGRCFSPVSAFILNPPMSLPFEGISPNCQLKGASSPTSCM